MIRVEISSGKLNAVDHDVLIGETIITALRYAGVPIKASAFVLRGVDTGTLSYHTDNGTHHFSWQESDTDRDIKFIRTASKDGFTIYKSGKHAEDDEL